MDLKHTLAAAEIGAHCGCIDCPSNPKAVPSAAFGTSCRDHGIDWSTPRPAVSMTIVRDPADTTPASTTKLCFVCNSENPSDGTARHAFDLWRAAVALADDGWQAERYLDCHYWTNAAMHGTVESNLPRARRCCTVVLRHQIDLLSPRVIIASGTDAATSLHELGLLQRPWSRFRDSLASGVYTETARLRSGSDARVYCTYHTSKRAVNLSVAKLYSEATDAMLEKKLSAMSATGAVDAFLSRYNLTDPEGRGMRVLLLHWLDIGAAIRSEYRHA